MDQYNCTGKKDGSKCSCKAKIMSCTPQGGARCKGGRCKQGSNKGFPRGLSDYSNRKEAPPPPIRQFENLMDCTGKKDRSKCSSGFRDARMCKDGKCVHGK